VVQEDNGWEESDEAWELGEGEMMIVGTVQQEDKCSWQAACDAWEAQEEEATAGTYQTGVDQESGEPAAKDQCKKVSIEKSDEWPPVGEGLLVEEEEQEYFLQLLMRSVSPERSTGNPPAKSVARPARKKIRKSKEKKARKKNLKGGAADEARKKEEMGEPASGKEKQIASNLAHNPKAKGRGLAKEDQQGRSQSAKPPATSGGECSG
jgi:hypothetical protein